MPINFQTKNTTAFQTKDETAFQSRRTTTPGLGWGYQAWGITAWGGRVERALGGWSEKQEATAFQSKTTTSFQEKI